MAVSLDKFQSYAYFVATGKYCCCVVVVLVTVVKVAAAAAAAAELCEIFV